jgi:hypothetical protein
MSLEHFLNGEISINLVTLWSLAYIFQFCRAVVSLRFISNRKTGFEEKRAFRKTFCSKGSPIEPLHNCSVHIVKLNS